MAKPTVVVGSLRGPNEEKWGKHLLIWCPGCDELHGPRVPGDNGESEPGKPLWSWNGDPENLTIDPSLLVYSGGRQGDERCHSFIRSGHWEFLSDSTHKLAGQTVPMVPVPDWLVK